MAQDFLTKEFLRERYNYDPGGFFVSKKTGKKRTGSPGRAGYLLLSFWTGGKFHGALYHRAVWIWHHGAIPEIIDHANRDRIDNRIENLRACTRSENQANRPGNRDKKHGIKLKGVGLSGRKTKPFCARIIHKKKYINLGRFHTEREAGEAYLAAAKRLFGEFAKGMDPDGTP